MDLLTRKIKAFKTIGATDDYITEVLSLVNHERRTAGLEFKTLLENKLKDSPEFQNFKVMDESAINKIINEVKKDWLSK